METSSKITFETVFRLCLILGFVSTFVTLTLSISLHNIQHENKHLTSFISKAGTLQSDFEQSLIMYTENTEAAMEFVNTLRPDNETEYIDFIGAVEALSHDMGLSVDLESLDSTPETLSFSARFYGSKSKLTEFIAELETLPYYVRIETLSYRDVSLVPVSNNKTETSNIQLTFVLYVK